MINQTFRTPIQVKKFPFKLEPDSKIMFLGSCFAENIGKKMENDKFNIDINPFGILYNPVSIKRSLEFLIMEKPFLENNMFYNNGLWNSFLHHSRFSGSDKQAVVTQINKRITNAVEFLYNCEYLFITFGTSWVYQHIETNIVVSNCHKLPSSTFHRKILTADEITIDYYQLIENILNINPKIKIIFTVSPIRHLNDGNTENFLSKSVLMIAVQQITSHFKNAFYFPAFEIMYDDLRDYRFYAKDLVHPNEIAIDYIYDIFSENLFSEKTKKIILEIEKIKKAKNHKVFQPKNEAYRIFLVNYIEIINNMNKKYSFLNLETEKQYFENELKSNFQN